jgi:hypothetical protein
MRPLGGKLAEKSVPIATSSTASSAMASLARRGAVRLDQSGNRRFHRAGAHHCRSGRHAEVVAAQTRGRARCYADPHYAGRLADAWTGDRPDRSSRLAAGA